MLVVVGLYYFTQKQYQPAPVPTVNQQAPVQTTQNVPSNNIVMENFLFYPKILTVNVGTTVVWINQDAAAHDIKSETFSSPVLSRNDQFQYTFSTKGTFNYSCGIHPSMTGTVVVE